MAKTKPAAKPSKKKPTPAAAPPGALRLEYRSPAELVENPLNWRRHPDAQISALSDVITEVGWAGACLLNERTGRLIDGHARRKVALDQGCELVPVLVGDWSEADEAKILATLDPLAAMAEADAAALDALLRDVKTGSQAVADMLTGLAEEAGVIPPDTTPGAGGDEFDATPEEEGPTRTAVGELWVIGGKHRLLVADSTAAENVARLMEGEKAALIVTDPPYGVDFKRGQFITDPARPSAASRGVGDAIQGDDRKAEDQQAFIETVFRTAAPHVLPGCPVYMFSAILAEGCHSYFGMLDAGLHVQSQLAWVKNVHALGQADYHWKHELCWYGWYPTGPHPWYGGRDKFTTLEFARDQATEHPNQKPVAILQHLVGNSSREGELLYEPFGGSGSLMIAAHRMGRVVRMCEIDPRYADLILKRAEAEGLTVEKAG